MKTPLLCLALVLAGCDTPTGPLRHANQMCYQDQCVPGSGNGSGNHVNADSVAVTASQSSVWALWRDSTGIDIYGLDLHTPPLADTARVFLPDTAAHVIRGVRLNPVSGIPLCTDTRTVHRGDVVTLWCLP